MISWLFGLIGNIAGNTSVWFPFNRFRLIDDDEWRRLELEAAQGRSPSPQSMIPPGNDAGPDERWRHGSDRRIEQDMMFPRESPPPDHRDRGEHGSFFAHVKEEDTSWHGCDKNEYDRWLDIHHRHHQTRREEAFIDSVSRSGPPSQDGIRPRRDTFDRDHHMPPPHGQGAGNSAADMPSSQPAERQQGEASQGESRFSLHSGEPGAMKPERFDGDRFGGTDTPPPALWFGGSEFRQAPGSHSHPIPQLLELDIRNPLGPGTIKPSKRQNRRMKRAERRARQHRVPNEAVVHAGPSTEQKPARKLPPTKVMPRPCSVGNGMPHSQAEASNVVPQVNFATGGAPFHDHDKPEPFDQPGRSKPEQEEFDEEYEEMVTRYQLLKQTLSALNDRERKEAAARRANSDKAAAALDETERLLKEEIDVPSFGSKEVTPGLPEDKEEPKAPARASEISSAEEPQRYWHLSLGNRVKMIFQ